ncbi:MAG: TlpA family protein disulfide reductase [Bacteroidales bacterium]|nr:TlpA family protein disulfide reductase [Bacteroidales bacterium]
MVTDALNARFPDNFYVKNLVRKMEAERKLGIGSIAPEISLPDPEGDTVSLSSLRGKVVLIDFWAAWCSPCRKENPNLRRIYRKFNSMGFEIFGVSLDKARENWLGAIASDSLSWPQVSDLNYWQSEAAATYQVTSIPHTVLIDREGRIIARKLRGEALEQKLEELFRSED